MRLERTRCLVIGYPVSHSLSPVMFGAAFRECGLDDWTYGSLAVPPGAAGETLSRLAGEDVLGLNVTMPLKGEVLAHCCYVTERARAVGAANTLTFLGDGWEADNTDWPGLRLAVAEALDGSPPPRGPRPAVVFGAGGAAAACAFCLHEMGLPVVVVNRDPGRARELARRVGGVPLPWGDAAVRRAVEEASVLVNATPLGMGADRRCPLPEGVLPPPDAVVCELVYHPPETEFLRRAREAGARTVDGLSVLLWQAVPAFERWTGLPAPVGAMRAALRTAAGSPPREEGAACGT